MNCLMLQVYEWTLSVKQCGVKGDSGPGDPQGPDCQKGWIPVNDYCIPPPDPDGEG
jgi:hypothetical protein